MLSFKKLNADAVIPTRGSQLSAGHDLYISQDLIVPAKGMAIAPTGLSVEFHGGYHYLRIAPRSGLAVKGIDVGAGVVDADYRGEIKVILYNHSDTDYSFKKHDRVAQMIVEAIHYVEVIKENKDLSETERGSAGFGSTGN
jgi:deoxyuridine 5'-triphosphate nucleotidohydrolase